MRPPPFSIGRGAVFTCDGKNELDASLMDGATRMAGDGAEIFAKERGIELVDPSCLRTNQRWRELQRALKEGAAGQAHADLATAKPSAPSAHWPWTARGAWRPALPPVEGPTSAMAGSATRRSSGPGSMQ